MKRSRFSDEQIIAMLKKNEAGAKVDDIAGVTACHDGKIARRARAIRPVKR